MRITTVLIPSAAVALLVIFLGCSKEPVGEKAAVAPPQGAVLALTFESRNISDASSAGMDVKVVGVRRIADGRAGWAARFVGKASISIPNIGITPAGTWSCWLRLHPETDYKPQMRVLDANGYGITIRNRQLRALFHDRRSISLDAGEIPPPGVWTHVALTWGDGRIEFLRDGVLASSFDQYSNRPTFDKRNLMIGTRWTGSGMEFTGDLDEVMIFSRRLNREEIAKLALKR